MTRSVAGIRQYAPGDVVDFVRVPWEQAHLAVCLDCGAGDCPRWLPEHKQATGHVHVEYVRAERHQHSSWCAPICGAQPKPARSARSVVPAGRPTDKVYAGPLMCLFGVAHSGGTETAPCPNCGQTVEAAA